MAWQVRRVSRRSSLALWLERVSTFGQSRRVRLNAISPRLSTRDDVTRALRAAHSGFYLSHKTISIGLIGPGTVGNALLRQLEKQSERLANDFNLDLRVRAIARSQTMLLGERRIELSTWEDDFEASAIETDLRKFEECS